MKVVKDPALTVSGLAAFITGDPLKQRSTLRDFKYPEPEGEGRAMYYSKSNNLIRSALHSSSPELRLRTNAIELEQELSTLDKIPGRSEHNLRVIKQFADIVATRNFTPAPRRHIAFVHAGVTIRATPELYVMEGGVLKLVKLHHKETPAGVNAANIIRRAIWLAATRSGLDIQPNQVVLLHTATGKELGTKARNQRLTELIQAACENIAMIWPTIPMPSPAASRRHAAGNP